MATTDGEKTCPLSYTAHCALLIITIIIITCYNCASNHCGNMCGVVLVTMLMGVMENLHFNVIRV